MRFVSVRTGAVYEVFRLAIFAALFADFFSTRSFCPVARNVCFGVNCGNQLVAMVTINWNFHLSLLDVLLSRFPSVPSFNDNLLGLLISWIIIRVIPRTPPFIQRKPQPFHSFGFSQRSNSITQTHGLRSTRAGSAGLF